MQSPPNSAAEPLKLTGIAMLALAALMLLCGMCSAALYVVMPFADRTNSLETNTILGAAAGFGFFFAAILGWQGLKDSASAARYFPPALAFALAFLGAIFLGAGVLAVKSIAPFVFPPFHFLAGMLIAGTFIAYAARRLGTQSGLRALFGSFAWGALGATLIAFVAEIVIAGVFVLVALIALLPDPSGHITLEQLTIQLRLARGSNAEKFVEQLIANPQVATGFLIYFALIIPPIEEAVKTLALAFVNPRRTQLADLVLWGMSAGAGFAALENLFNAAGMLNLWAAGMLMRFGATTMHVANGALMGQGWYAARVEGKWRKLFTAYTVSVMAHALWNGSVITLTQRAASLGADPGNALSQLPAQGALILALVAIIVILSVLGLVWIVYTVKNAQQKLSREVESQRGVNP